MITSIREETLYRKIFKSKNIFFLDFSEYNTFKRIKIKSLEDLVVSHYYVEIFSSRSIGWTFHVRSYRSQYSKHWYRYILKCPTCNKNIFRINNNKGICKSNHRNDLDKLIPKFLRISTSAKIK